MRLSVIPLVLSLLVVAFCVKCSAQDEMELINDIARFQAELKSEKAADRDAAQKALMEIGEFVLDHLEMPDRDDESDYRRRVTEVRTSLEKIAVERATKPSNIQLDSNEIKVADLLKAFKEQTENDVILSDEVLLATAEMSVNFESKEMQFWDAMSEFMEKAKLRIDPYAGKGGQLALVEIGDNSAGVATSEYVDYSEVLRFEVTRVDASINFLNPNQSFSSMNFVVRWEPRIKPIAIDFLTNEFEIKDEYDQEYKATGSGNYTAIVSAGLPNVDFTVGTPSFDRQIERLKEVKGKVRAVLPGRTETFKFKNIGGVEEGKAITKAGATVTYFGARKNEDIWELNLQLSFDEDNNALESHQSWAYNNEVYLLDENGEKEQPISENISQPSDNTLVITYIFISEPKEQDLYYRTPASIVKVLIPFAITGIPLP